MSEKETQHSTKHEHDGDFEQESLSSPVDYHPQQNLEQEDLEEIEAAPSDVAAKAELMKKPVWSTTSPTYNPGYENRIANRSRSPIIYESTSPKFEPPADHEYEPFIIRLHLIDPSIHHIHRVAAEQLPSNSSQFDVAPPNDPTPRSPSPLYREYSPHSPTYNPDSPSYGEPSVAAEQQRPASSARYNVGPANNFAVQTPSPAQIAAWGYSGVSTVEYEQMKNKNEYLQREHAEMQKSIKRKDREIERLRSKNRRLEEEGRNIREQMPSTRTCQSRSSERRNKKRTSR